MGLDIAAGCGQYVEMGGLMRDLCKDRRVCGTTTGINESSYIRSNGIAVVFLSRVGARCEVFVYQIPSSIAPSCSSRQDGKLQISVKR